MHLALGRTRPSPTGTVKNDSIVSREQWSHSLWEEEESSIEPLLTTLYFKHN